VHTSKQYRTAALLVCGIIALVRLVTLGIPDLVDTTEGRYAGVAQLMLERDDWVTPWIHYQGEDKPYLGKPPLHFWLLQLCFLAFGQNNFAARLPGFLSAVGITGLVGYAARVLLGTEAAIIAAGVLGSSCMMFYLGGAVVLDVTLTLGITLALVAFLVQHRGWVWRYLFFVGIGLGVLVKGPLAAVLVGGILGPWLVIQRLVLGRWPTQFTTLPWIRGVALCLAIVIPWYIWAEVRNPGFLKYFLWNENFGRYLKSDYGDVYGTGHRQPIGACFGMMILAVFPWSIILFAMAATRIKGLLSKGSAIKALTDPELLFALCWALSCPVLLLGATQYTATYLMPSVPGFALLTAACWNRQTSFTWISTTSLARILRISGIVLGLLGVIGAVILHWYGAPLISSFSGLALGLIAIWLFLRLDSKSPTLYTASAVAVLTGCIYGTASWCTNNYLSNNRSSHRVLRLVRTIAPSEATPRIGFPYYYPFSASFYSKADPELRSTSRSLKEGEVKDADVDFFVVRRRNMQKFREETGITTEVASVGQWRIVRNERR
jgi:4-amino-4-deoxy-L-arabinose transferase-like glycosyltransferase